MSLLPPQLTRADLESAPTCADSSRAVPADRCLHAPIPHFSLRAISAGWCLHVPTLWFPLVIACQPDLVTCADSSCRTKKCSNSRSSACKVSRQPCLPSIFSVKSWLSAKSETGKLKQKPAKQRLSEAESTVENSNRLLFTRIQTQLANIRCSEIANVRCSGESNLMKFWVCLFFWLTQLWKLGVSDRVS